MEEKATLDRILIEEIDTEIDPGAQKLWLDESKRRYEALLREELEARPGEEVMLRVRDRLRSTDR